MFTKLVRRHRGAGDRSRFGDLDQLFRSTQVLDLETLETRQMLSSTVLTDAQLVDAAVSYLRQNASEYGLVANDLNHYQVVNQYTTDHLGVNHVYLKQSHQGLNVRDGVINVNVRLDGRVVSAGSDFVSGLYDDWYSLVPEISAADGLESLAEHYQWTSVVSPELIVAATTTNRAGRFTGGDLSTAEIPVHLEFVPVGNGAVELAWTYVVRRPYGESWMHSSVSAIDGELLAESNWVDNAIYNVFQPPLEGPLYGTQTLIVDPNDLVASPFGWHDIDGIPGIDRFDTSGNNVHAQTDRFALDNGTGPRAVGGVNLEFPYTYNRGAQPVSSTDAATTNLFYWNNLLHDVHYHYGFNEAAGNFQENNYGRGGMGSDSVQADAQYGARVGLFNNAFFATPPDGQTPQMAMLEWRQFPFAPNRDSSYENTVVVHEFGHGISNRLTGGPANADALEDIQSGGMGEGWSDFWALMFTQAESHNADTSRTMANWLIFDDLLLTPGIRRNPYSFDMFINPLTFADYNLSSQVHDAGEIWASILWDMNWLLIDGSDLLNDNSVLFSGYGFDKDLVEGTGGNNIALQLIMDGLKLQPANPSFLEARDAILLADRLANGGANQTAIWSAFARRGMGYSAVDNGSNSTFVIEAFDIPNFSQGVITLDRADYDIETETIEVELFDIDLAGSGSHVVTIESNTGDIENVIVTESLPGFFHGSIQSAKGTIYFQDGLLQLLPEDTITATYRDADIGDGTPGVATDNALINGTLPPGGGQSRTTYSSLNVPQTLNNPGTTFTTLFVTDTYPIGDVNITLDITYPQTIDIDAYLISPAGTRVELFTAIGGNTFLPPNFTNTTLDDEADDPIVTAFPPFNGSFRPEGLLADFDGEVVNGIWTLEVVDNLAAFGGVLNSWSIDVLNANFGQRRFDFGWDTPPIGPIAKDHIGITTQLYDVNQGYGWLPGAVELNPLMRNDGSRLSRDFVYLRRGVFVVDVPNGVYDITVYVGDTLNNHDSMGVFLEGQFRESITTQAGEVATRIYRTTVLDNQLTVRLRDFGGFNPYVTLVGLVVDSVDEYHFDFGTTNSPIAAGYQQVTNAAYTPAAGYGWLADTNDLGVLSRANGNALTRDLAYLKRGTFAVDLPTGEYDVRIHFGDSLNAHDIMGLWLEGVYKGFTTTVAGQIKAVDNTAFVSDGQLDIYFQDLGGANKYVTIVGIELKPVGQGGFESFSEIIATESLVGGTPNEQQKSASFVAAGALPTSTELAPIERTESQTGNVDFSRYASPLLLAPADVKANQSKSLDSISQRWQLKVG